MQLERPDHDWVRDGYGRPIILPDPTWVMWPGRSTETGGDPGPASWRDEDGNLYPDRRYTRVTTYGEALLDGSALGKWKMRRVMLGAGRRPDYVTAAAALTAEDRDKAALNDLAEKALEAAGPNAADIGTALHGFTERIDRGEDVGVVPPEYRADLDAYRHVIAPLTFLHRECRMVCDQLETAGTPDGIALCGIPDPDGVVDVPRIVDLKTGNVEFTAGKFSTQLAIYAHSQLYDPRDGARTGLDLSTRWGVVIHMPAGMGTAQLRWLNLEHGWTGALLAGPVREWRKKGARELSRPVFLPAGVTWSEDGKCQGKTKAGEACGVRASDNGFCGKHQGQATGDPVVTQGTGEPADPDEAVEQELAAIVGQPATPQPVDEPVDDYPEERAALLARVGLPYPVPIVEDPPEFDVVILPEGASAQDLLDAADALLDAPEEPETAEDAMRAMGLHRTGQIIPEQNGNPTPASGIGTPQQAAAAAVDAEDALLRQVAGCQAPTELQLLWQATGHMWTPAVRRAATERQEAVQQLPVLRRQQAALLTAIQSATWGELAEVFHAAGRVPGLWTAEHTEAARTRSAELAGA